MVTDLVMDLLELAFGVAVAPFPLTSFNPVALFGDALSHLGDLNYFLPIAEMVAVLVSALVIFPAFAGVTLFLWLLAFIRGGSARG